jgi:hypothetical protein
LVAVNRNSTQGRGNLLLTGDTGFLPSIIRVQQSVAQHLGIGEAAAGTTNRHSIEQGTKVAELSNFQEAAP